MTAAHRLGMQVPPLRDPPSRAGVAPTATRDPDGAPSLALRTRSLTRDRPTPTGRWGDLPARFLYAKSPRWMIPSERLAWHIGGC
jgi:hypothetical protein